MPACSPRAKRCARALVAALGGRESPPAPMESVCYSLVAADRALSIHASFEVERGKLKPTAAKPSDGEPGPPAPADSAPSLAEAENAAAWYAGILADSFGALPPAERL